MITWDNIKYFKPNEFVRDGFDFAPVMSEKFIIALDTLRRRCGHPIAISQHPKALGRFDHKHRNSQHYIDNGDSIEGVLSVADLMPHTLYDGEKYSLSRQQIETFVELAANIGFTGIGVYPDWHPLPGVHLDMRDPIQPGYIAQWSALNQAVQYEGKTIIKQKYFGIDRGMQAWPRSGMKA